MKITLFRDNIIADLKELLIGVLYTIFFIGTIITIVFLLYTKITITWIIVFLLFGGAIISIAMHISTTWIETDGEIITKEHKLHAWFKIKE